MSIARLLMTGANTTGNCGLLPIEKNTKLSQVYCQLDQWFQWMRTLKINLVL